MSSLNLSRLTKKKILDINRILRHVPEITNNTLTNIGIELLDIHLHLPEYKQNVTHSHECYELHSVIIGNGTLCIDNKTLEFSEGQFTLTKPSIEHNWFTNNYLLMFVIQFKLLPKKNIEKSDVFKLCDAIRNITRNVYKLPETHITQMEFLINEISKHKIGYNFLCQEYIQIILLSCFRSTLNKKLTINDLDISETDQIVKVIDQYIEDNFSKDISLDNIANLVCKSKRTIMRHYKLVHKMSIGERIRQKRLYNAQEMLKKTDLPIKAIAYKCGIPDPAYFCNFFKSEFGVSPIEFRCENKP